MKLALKDITFVFKMSYTLNSAFSQTARGKWEYARQEVESMFRLGRPVLVGTTR